MAASLILHELTGSPNNVKVRIGLGYKGLPYERRALKLDGFPGDRSALVKLSGQPRTPVLQHGATVIFDSQGILRYLDANFRETKPLFSSDYAEMGEIEDWEIWARTELARPIGVIFEQMFSPSPDADACRKADVLFHEVTGRIEARLAESPHLVRSTPSGADLATAPFVNLAMLPESAEKGSPIAAFFRTHLHVGTGRERTQRWVESLMAYDQASPR